MGVFVIQDGIPVQIDDRLWMFDENTRPVAPNAYMGSITLDPEVVWRTQRNVRMVVGFLARNIAQVGLHAFTMDEDGERDRLARDHALSKLLRKPADTVTPYELMRDSVVDLCMWDRFAARFTLTDDGPMLVRLPPKGWKFKRDGLDRPTAIVTADSSDPLRAVREWPLEDFLWLDGYPCVHEKPLEWLAGLLAEEQESQNYRIELWRSGARLGGWIERPSTAPPWSSTAKDKFRDGWQEYAALGERAGKTPILEDDMKYHEVKEAITPESAQQLESRKFSVAECAAAFYVPPVFVGLLDYTSHSNVDAYRESLYSDVLGPWFQQIQQAWNARLVHRSELDTGDLDFVEFNVEEKLRMNFDEQTKVLQTAVGGPFMTRAEARRIRNLPFIDGTDELIVPLNVITGGQASPTDSAPPQE